MLGAIGVMLGFPLADPIVGLLIAISILILLWGTVKFIGARLMDAVDPALVEKIEHALEHIPEVVAVEQVRLRWIGHRLDGEATIRTPDLPLSHANRIAHDAEESAKQHLPNLDEITIRVKVG